MTKQEFIKRVVDEVSEGGAVPIAPNSTRVSAIIDNALRYFWEKDDEAVQHEYIVISSRIINTPLYKAKRQIQLPKCVEAISKVHELGSWINSMDINPDFRKTNYNYHMAVVGDSDSMVYGVVAAYYADFMRNFIVRTVAYEFNPHTSALTIVGRDQFIDLVCEAWVHIEPEAMYEMDRLFRYVCGKCMMSFGRVFGLVETKLIGGYKLDVSGIKEDGKAMIDQVNKELDEQRSSADFMDEF